MDHQRFFNLKRQFDLGNERFFLFANLLFARLGVIEMKIIKAAFPYRDRLFVKREPPIRLNIERLAARGERFCAFATAQLALIVMRPARVNRVETNRRKNARLLPFRQLYRRPRRIDLRANIDHPDASLASARQNRVAVGVICRELDVGVGVEEMRFGLHDVKKDCTIEPAKGEVYVQTWALRLERDAGQ